MTEDMTQISPDRWKTFPLFPCNDLLLSSFSSCLGEESGTKKNELKHNRQRQYQFEIFKGTLSSNLSATVLSFFLLPPPLTPPHQTGYYQPIKSSSRDKPPRNMAVSATNGTMSAVKSRHVRTLTTLEKREGKCEEKNSEKKNYHSHKGDYCLKGMVSFFLVWELCRVTNSI